MPKAPTLRQLADGAATDGAGNRDPEKAERYYARLMRAAGYLSGESGDTARSEPSPPPDEPWAPLRKLPGASIALTDLARGAPEWDDDDREFVEGTLEQLAQRFGRPANAR